MLLFYLFQCLVPVALPAVCQDYLRRKRSPCFCSRAGDRRQCKFLHHRAHLPFGVPTGPGWKNFSGIVTPSFLNTIPFFITNCTLRNVSMLLSGWESGPTEHAYDGSTVTVGNFFCYKATAVHAKTQQPNRAFLAVGTFTCRIAYKRKQQLLLRRECHAKYVDPFQLAQWDAGLRFAFPPLCSPGSDSTKSPTGRRRFPLGLPTIAEQKGEVRR